MSSLVRAVQSGSLTKVKACVEDIIIGEISIEAKQEMCMEAAKLAIEYGKGDLIRLLLTCKVFQRKHKKILQLEIPHLLYHVASVAKPEHTREVINIITAVSSETKQEVMKYVNEDGFSCMHIAAWEGNVMAARRLLVLGADSKQKSLDGNTALSLAIANNRTSFWEFILPFSNVNSYDEDHDTPLMFAAWRKNHHLVMKLIDYGANVNASSRHESTALWNAVFRGSVDCVTVLLQNNADMSVCCEGTYLFLSSDESGGVVNKIYPGKNRSLMWVAIDMMKKQPIIVSVLIESGYDVTKEHWIARLIQGNQSYFSQRSKFELSANSDLPNQLKDNQMLQKLLIFYYSRPLRLRDLCRNRLRAYHRESSSNGPFHLWLSKLGLGRYMEDFLSLGYLQITHQL